MPEVRPAMARQTRQRRQFPARREQQLPAGRTIEPGQLHEREREARRQPQHKAGWARIGQRAGAGGGGAQSGPVGRGWAWGPPPCACCSFIFFNCAAAAQALPENATLLTWLALSCAIAPSGTWHQSLFFSI